MFLVVSAKQIDLLKRIHLPHGPWPPPSLILCMQEIEIYMWKVRVRPIVPDSRVPNTVRIESDGPERNTQHHQQQECDHVIAKTC